MSREVYADRALLECDSAKTTCYMCRRARPACEGTFRGGDAAIGVELCPSCCRAGLHESGCRAIGSYCSSDEGEVEWRSVRS